LLFELNRSVGSTLVLVTHDRSLAQRCARVLELDAGRYVSTGATRAAAPAAVSPPAASPPGS
jgi:ABC-type lipoprotein export system ATPase subunit